MKKKLINQIYRVLHSQPGKFIDNDWSNLYRVLDEISSKVGVSISVDGTAWKSNGPLTQWKEYKLTISKDDVVIKGILNAHAAGTIADPFSSYDLTLSMS